MAAIVPALIALWLKSRRGGGGGGGYGGRGGGGYGGRGGRGGYGRTPKPQESEEEKSMKYLNLNALKEGIDSNYDKMPASGNALQGLLDFDPVKDLEDFEREAGRK
jgi:hypothetical protein